MDTNIFLKVKKFALLNIIQDMAIRIIIQIDMETFLERWRQICFIDKS